MADTSTNFASHIFAWLRQVDTDPETSAMEFRLAYVISQMINKKARACFPLQSTLAERLGVDVRTIGRGTANLVKRGHLSVARRGREQSAIYKMILHDRTPVSDHDEARPDTDVRSKPPQDKTSLPSRPDTGVPKTGHPCPREPTSITNLNNQKGGAPQARPATDSSCKSSLNSRSATTIDDCDDGIGVGCRPPPPLPTHIDLAIARAYRLKQHQGGVR